MSENSQSENENEEIENEEQEDMEEQEDIEEQEEDNEQNEQENSEENDNENIKEKETIEHVISNIGDENLKIQNIVSILSDFKNLREEGKSRNDYILELKNLCQSYFEYNSDICDLNNKYSEKNHI